ncbi:MAG: hypothetical protein NTX00_00380 [Candidatus Parcubacteria bacterium]|nr:hypothetical protein [Candidatus Parcubacteria bacterium]
MQNPASLAQKYGQVIMGFLTQAVIKREELKSKKHGKKENLILPVGFEPIIGKILSAFGELGISETLTEENNAPVIFAKPLVDHVKDYLNKFQIEFNPEIYGNVLRDLVGLGLLINGPNYWQINTVFFAHKTTEQSSISLRQALETRMRGLLKNIVVAEILLVLCESAGLTEDEVATIPPQYRRSVFLQNLGRGMLLYKVRAKGIKYDPFMRTVDALVKQDILIEGCNDLNTEIVMINPVLKPFSVIVEIIDSLTFTQKPSSIVEIEVSNGVITPFSSMVNMGNLGKDPRDIYLFSDYEFGLQGL